MTETLRPSDLFSGGCAGCANVAFSAKKLKVLREKEKDGTHTTYDDDHSDMASTSSVSNI